MSTRSTIFLTKDNEHCYHELGIPYFDENKQYIGTSIVLEMAKYNIEILINDNEDLVIEIKPGSELYKIFDSLDRIKYLTNNGDIPQL